MLDDLNGGRYIRTMVEKEEKAGVEEGEVAGGGRGDGMKLGCLGEGGWVVEWRVDEIG